MDHNRKIADLVQAAVALWVVTLIVGWTFATVLPAAALQADSSDTGATPNTPGDTAEYRITVVTERGDAIVENGLKHVILDFGTDSDFTGNASGVTAADITIRVEDGTTERMRSVGPTSVVADDGSELLITLDAAYTRIDPGDRIVVEVEGVTNSEIAIDDPRGPRGFALGVGMADTRGTIDGPVKVRYALDPTARAAATTTPTAQPTTTTTASSPAGTTTTTSTPTTPSERKETSGIPTEDSRTVSDGSKTALPTATSDPIPATDVGVGIAVALVALLASALITTRYR